MVIQNNKNCLKICLKTKLNILITNCIIKYLRRESMWSGTELNRRHEDFQSSALPTELPDHIQLWSMDLTSSRGKYFSCRNDSIDFSIIKEYKFNVFYFLFQTFIESLMLFFSLVPICYPAFHSLFCSLPVCLLFLAFPQVPGNQCKLCILWEGACFWIKRRNFQ